MAEQQLDNFVFAAMHAFYGPRCPYYDPICNMCKAWDEYDKLIGVVPREMENMRGGRSGKWAHFVEQLITERGECIVCGNKKLSELTGHHIKPFHLEPELELDPKNIVIVCREAKLGLACHMFVGHRGNFRDVNPDVVKDAAFIRKIMDGRAHV